jgi:hypothetical protein
MANISHRLGQLRAPQEIQEIAKTNADISDAFERCRAYLRDNGVDLQTSQAVAGPWVTLDAEQERFVGEFAEGANKLARREYRKPFVVPELA